MSLPESSNLSQLIRVFGKVQGVGYRNWTVATARSLRITGWVRNRKDGSVEILATGQPGEIKRFIEACHRGPVGAHVELVNTAPTLDQNLGTFEQRETV